MKENLPCDYESEKKKNKIIITFADIREGVEARAQEMADAQMNADKDELSGMGGFLKKIWRHNLAYDFYRRKELNRAREEINVDGNLYSDQNNGLVFSNETRTVLAQRLSSEFEEVLHEGENVEAIGGNENDDNFKSEISDLIKQFVREEVNEDVLVEEKNRLLSTRVSSVRSQNNDAKVNYADNVLLMARELKNSMDHGEGLGRLDNDFEIRFGKGRLGVRTEAQYNWIDRTTNKMMGVAGKLKIDSLINESVLGSAVAGAYCLTAGLAKKVSMSKISMAGTFGATALAGSALAAARESRMLENERKQHAREMAQGSEVKSNSKRRESMKSYRYETVTANSLIQSLETLTQNEINQDSLEADLGALANIEARIRLSDRNNIDLVSYSHINKVEEERFALDIARAKAKVNLRKCITDGSLRLPVNGGFDGYLESLTDTRIEDLTRHDISEKDVEFKKYKRKEVLKKAGKTLAYGIAFGAVFNEAFAFVKDNHEGLIEGMVKGHVNKTSEHIDFTPLEYLRRYIAGDFPRMDDSSFRESLINGGDIKLPIGVDLVENGNGTYDLTRSGEVFCQGLEIDANGKLTDASKILLEDKGMNISESVKHIQHMVPGKTTVEGFIDNHDEIFTKIKRTLWYDNDTPKPVFDKNELRTDWGGENGSGIDKDGNFVMNIKRMISSGSYHDKFSVDATKEMSEGKLKLLLTVSQGTQDKVIPVDVDATGNIIIDKFSEAGKLLFGVNENSHAVFKGRFAEVAEMMGNKEGVEQVRILSTVVGRGINLPEGAGLMTDNASIIDNTSVVGNGINLPESVVGREINLPNEFVPITDYVPVINDTPETIIGVPGDYGMEMPFFVPVTGRQPMEKVKSKIKSERTEGYGYYGAEDGYGLLAREKYNSRFSGKLRENCDLDVSSNDSDLISEYLKKQDQKYIKELELMISKADKMNETVDLVITVPCYQEGSNLEKTLEKYAKIKNYKKFEICILENHPANIHRDNTPKVINSIKKKFPDLNITHLYKKFEEKPTIGEVRKYLVDSVLLRKSKANIKKSVVIASNDADLEDINKDYADIIIDKFKEDKELDAIGAKWDFPKETFQKMPLLHASQRLWQYFDIVFRRLVLKSPELIGRNSAFRSGIYAAVGGYNKTSKLAEDLEIGWLIKHARNYDAKRIKYLNKAWLVSNPRRAVVKLLLGGRLIQQYGDFHTNEDVRKASLSELLNKKIDFSQKQFALEVQAIYDYYMKFRKSVVGGWAKDDKVKESFSKAMKYVGINYEIIDNKVEIIDMKKLTRGLKKYENSKN